MNPKNSPGNNPDPQANKQRTRSRIMLLFLAAIFFGPLIAAWVFYYGFPELIPTRAQSHGELLDPARPLPELVLRTPDNTIKDEQVFQDQRWTFFFFADQPCDEACRKRLYDTRQVRTALHKRAPRVQRIYIASDASYWPDKALVSEQHPDLELYVIESGGLQNFLNKISANAGKNSNFYVVDPLGNVLLYYRSEDKAKGLLEDIKRLLKLSHIG